MKYTDYMRSLEKPYWCRGSPLKWQVDGIGIARFAQEGQVGLFNLSYYVLQRSTPPQSQMVYRQTNLCWVIMLAGNTRIGKFTLEEHAAFKTLQEFSSMLLPAVRGRRVIENGVPWDALLDIAKAVMV